MKFKVGCLVLLTTTVTFAAAQVASHAPSTLTNQPNSKTAGTAPISDITGRVVARVNGAELTDRDLVREMVAMFPYAGQHNGFPKDLEPEIRRGALQMIIFEELLYQEAKKRKLTVPAFRISQAEKAFRSSFSSQAEYDSFLKLEAINSRQALQQKIRRSLLIEAMLKTDVAAKSKVTLTQAKIYYDKNPKLFYRGETFHIQSISILPPNAAPDTVKEAKKRADDAYKQAKSVTTYREFGLLAEKLSDDDFHVNYGDHKPRPSKELPPDVVKAAQKMKPGQVSNLIQLGNAYTIFRLIAHIPAGTIPFAEVKVSLQSDLQKQRTEQVRASLGNSLRKDAKIEIL
jgi:foldase protein PrsA